MRYAAKVDQQLGETSIEMASNCYTDSFPIVKRLLFRKTDIDLSAQGLVLACAVLTARFCGEQFEFVGVKIGSDYAEAIRRIVGEHANVTIVDGQNRRLSNGEVDLLCQKASTRQPSETRAEPVPDTTPLARLDWSGDFVDRTTRSSSGFCFGACQTNAQVLADDTLVSIAIGLLHSRDRCRNLYVPVAPGARGEGLRQIKEALRIVSINLELLEAA